MSTDLNTASYIAPLQETDPVALRSLREHVHGRLRTLILAGRFQEGQRLQERELAGLLGISVTPVKDALRMLEGEGLVRIEARRGVFVLFGPGRAHEMALMRACIEGVISSLAAQRATNEAISAIGALLPAMDKATRAGELEALVEINERFHSAIHQAARADYLAERLESQKMYDHTRRLAVLQDTDERLAGYNEHKAVYEAIAARAPEKAESVMRAHILRSANRFLIHVFGSRHAEVPHAG